MKSFFFLLKGEDLRPVELFPGKPYVGDAGYCQEGCVLVRLCVVCCAGGVERRVVLLC